jgi:glyoxylase-like metal-dependent hydrolase (beta-lactamase superfamily II)
MARTLSSRSALLSIPLVLVAALGAAIGSPATQSQSADPPPAFEMPELNYVEVSASVTLLRNERPYGSNITCFALEDGLIFVDTSFFTEIAAKFRKEMEAKYGKRTLALLLSHGHTDHFFGMGAFEDVPVAAAASARRLFEHQLGIDFEAQVEGYERIFPKFGQALKSARLSMPTLWFQQEIEFGSGDSVVRFRNTGGHSAGSSFAYMPSQAALATGDNLQVDAFPYFGDPTGDMGTWIETLEGWESLGKVTFCPGHGRPVDLAYMTATKVFFEELHSVLSKLKAEGLPVQEVVEHSSLPKGYWGAEAQEPPWYRRIIGGLYRSLGDE